MSKIAIACATDERYGLPLAVALSSLVRNLGDGVECRIIVLACDLSSDTRCRLERAVSHSRKSVDVGLEIKDVDTKSFSNLYSSANLSAQRRTPGYCFPKSFQI